jgi:putative Mg2+ transporter-C (MgtC) family protein
MIVSISMADISPGFPADPARIAAQVVSGIGFIGAGTIMREGASVRGLTTAASLWVVSAIGLGIGASLYLASCGATLIVILALVILGRVERVLLSRRLLTMTVVIADKPGQIGRIGTALGNRNIDIKDIEMTEISDQRLQVVLRVRVPPGVDPNPVLQEIVAIDGVHSVDQR